MLPNFMAFGLATQLAELLNDQLIASDVRRDVRCDRTKYVESNSTILDERDMNKICKMCIAAVCLWIDIVGI